MKRKGLFITGTDTDVGKTYITSQIIRQLSSIAVPIKVRKPIESGCSPESNGELHPSDGTALWQANDKKENLQTVTPYRFEPAIAPNRAAALKNKVILNQDLKNACLNNVTDTDYLIVEGAGGFYSPLSTDGLNADLAKALNLNIVLVVNDQLGCINHTLLTLEAISNKGLSCALIILNQCSDESKQLFNHAEEIEQLAKIKVSTCYKDDSLTDITDYLI